jgi:hypothetical protein
MIVSRSDGLDSSRESGDRARPQTRRWKAALAFFVAMLAGVGLTARAYFNDMFGPAPNADLIAAVNGACALIVSDDTAKLASRNSPELAAVVAAFRTQPITPLCPSAQTLKAAKGGYVAVRGCKSPIWQLRGPTADAQRYGLEVVARGNEFEIRAVADRDADGRLEYVAKRTRLSEGPIGKCGPVFGVGASYLQDDLKLPVDAP